MVTPARPRTTPTAARRLPCGQLARRRRHRTAVLAVLLTATVLVVADLSGGHAERRVAHRTGPAAATPSATPTGSTPTVPGRAAPGMTVYGPAAPRPSRSGPTASGPTASGPTASGPSASGAGSETGTGTAAGMTEVAVNFPVTGSGAFRYASGASAVAGAAGRLRRYRVAVEADAGQDAADFAAVVDRVLADRRGWTASGRLRLQRYAGRAHFTIYLATPGTSERMCATGGLRTDRYTSCRIPGKVIINLARWWGSVPGYGAPLDVYRTYAINHEVGHELGYGHEACPRPGRRAPVMQQQTLGLQGCRANGWPYVGTRRYAGRPVAGK